MAGGNGVSGVVVICAANNWDDVRLSDRPLAEALSAFVPVVYVDPPLPPLAPRHNPRLAKALRPPWFSQVGPRLWRVTPIVGPWPLKPAMTSTTAALTRLQIRLRLRSFGAVRAVVSTWVFIDAFDLFPDARHLYWTQDDTAAGAAHWNLDAGRLLAAERRVAEAADLVVAASPLSAERWSGEGFRALALPNGCDIDRFEQAPSGPVPERLPGPVAGFVGHLNERTDLGLLEAVVDRGMSLLLVGPVDKAVLGPRWDALVARSRVRAVGPQPFEDLPRWLAAMDVGLVPYRVDDFNIWSFPLKILEYLAAGLPVVSTDLPAVEWLDCPHVGVGKDVASFADAALAAGALGGSDTLTAQRRDFARKHSWTERARSLLTMLG